MSIRIGIGIDITKPLSKALAMVLAYFARVTAAGGFYEGKECLATKLNSLDAIQLLDNASLITIPSGYKSGVVYSQVPTSGAGDLDFTRASTATRINSSGLIESVATGVPRLDYPIGGGCPSLLLEPQRTNSILYSEQFDNGAWVKLGIAGASAPVVTANSTTAPDGNLTADKIVFNAPTSGDVSIIKQNISLTGTANGSIYIKAFSSGDVGKIIGFRFNADTYGLITLTNTWQRFDVTQVALESFDIHLRPSVGTSSGSVSVYVWGAQVEAGTYPTSYIPTTSAAVTRIAESASKTGISSLIGQTEGTVYYDLNLNSRVYYNYIFLGDAFTYIGIVITDTVIGLEIVNGTVQTAINYSNSNKGQFKIGVAYKNNDIAFYINGVLIGTDNTCNVPALSAIDLSYNQTNSIGFNNVNLYKTRLTNSQLATLTTI